MGWIQEHDANWRVPYTGGWCLKYVQDAFGSDHPYPSAIDAWNANYGNGNHFGELPPVGKTVLVYFSLGNVPAGHVAISLDDGCVASSTQSGTHSQGFIHPNLDNLISIYGKYNGGCTYLGWSEYCGSMKVLVNETTSQETSNTHIIFDTIKQNDPNIDLGQEVVVQSGQDGQRTVIYNVVYHDGVEVGRVVVSDATRPPVSTIIHVGTKAPEPVIVAPTEPPVEVSAPEPVVVPENTTNDVVEPVNTPQDTIPSNTNQTLLSKLWFIILNWINKLLKH